MPGHFAAMHSGRDWSFKERLYTNTAYNTADETLKGDDCNESEDPPKTKTQISKFNISRHPL